MAHGQRRSAMRRWVQRATLGWAVAALLLAALVAVLAAPGVLNEAVELAESEANDRWEEFVFFHPNHDAGVWRAWPETDDGPAIEGGVVWSEPAQRGIVRIHGLKPLTPTAVGEPAVYQVWLVTGSPTGAPDPSRFIGAGMFEVPSHADEHQGHGAGALEQPVPWLVYEFEPGIVARDIGAVAITAERAGGVWLSGLEHTVAQAQLAPSGYD